MTIEPYADQFLLAALDISGGDVQEILGTDQVMHAAQLATVQTGAIISWLLSQRYVKDELTQANGVTKLIRLTVSGLEHAYLLRRRSESRVEREQYLHNTLVRWAHEHAPAGGWAQLQLFAADDKWWFCGTEVTWDEVFAAIDYLEVKGLLRADRGPTSGPVAAGIAPTPLGTDFAHSHQLLGSFMNSQQPPGASVTNYISSNVVHGAVSGGNMATGGNNTQTSSTGIDADALAALVAQLREMAPNLDLSEDDAQDLADEIDTLEREGTEPGRGARAMRSIRRIMGQAALTAATEQGVVAALGAGAALFG
ncbi:hypothetical protein JIX56_19530 [Streptomyces sp. CA-210063]|uniref:hypothetical protein n=1 Tax=Streptomyces sp. CA-210063 TaxID=2801029 RepID=UPI00214B6558|nr:hypothetical protein [Streptomyces sp. CA-210063]UUU31914.1 hypothetical protein JIX56_19530 [Streptomyces sp. CA-210063]